MIDRRELLKFIGLGAGATAGDALLRAAKGRGGAVAQTADADVVELTAAQAAAAIRSGDLSAEAYAERLIAQGEAWRHLNAFISEDPSALLAAANAADGRRRGIGRGEHSGVPEVTSGHGNCSQAGGAHGADSLS